MLLTLASSSGQLVRGWWRADTHAHSLCACVSAHICVCQRAQICVNGGAADQSVISQLESQGDMLAKKTRLEQSLGGPGVGGGVVCLSTLAGNCPTVCFDDPSESSRLSGGWQELIS